MHAADENAPHVAAGHGPGGNHRAVGNRGGGGAYAVERAIDDYQLAAELLHSGDTVAHFGKAIRPSDLHIAAFACPHQHYFAECRNVIGCR